MEFNLAAVILFFTQLFKFGVVHKNSGQCVRRKLA